MAYFLPKSSTTIFVPFLVVFSTTGYDKRGKDSQTRLLVAFSFLL
jgi:hypothetical protein